MEICIYTHDDFEELLAQAALVFDPEFVASYLLYVDFLAPEVRLVEGPQLEETVVEMDLLIDETHRVVGN